MKVLISLPPLLNGVRRPILPGIQTSTFTSATYITKHLIPPGNTRRLNTVSLSRLHPLTFVLLTSVFTHMLPQDMDNYLSEVARVLKPDGRCLITYFLLNPESLALIDAEESSFNFQV